VIADAKLGPIRPSGAPGFPPYRNIPPKLVFYLADGGFLCGLAAEYPWPRPCSLFAVFWPVSLRRLEGKVLLHFATPRLWLTKN